MSDEREPYSQWYWAWVDHPAAIMAVRVLVPALVTLVVCLVWTALR